jgi:hypothetical protein
MLVRIIMKTRTLILFVFLNSTLSFCQNSDKETWKSKVLKLELTFESNQWEIITPFLDTENKIIIGLIDKTDHSSIVVKITQDVPKEQLSDEQYNIAIKEQMLQVNAENKLINDDKINFKGLIYKRLVFFMKTKYGDFVQTIYIHRNGEKIIGIQSSYPKNLVKKLNEGLPSKIEKVLKEMKI